MYDYFLQFFVEHQMGYGYIITNILLVCAAVFLLRNFHKGKRGILLATLECILGSVIYFFLDSVYYSVFGGWQMDRIVLGLFVLLYAVIRSNHDARVCLVRGWMFLSCAMVIIPVSEPIGELIWSVNKSWQPWAQYMTPAVIAIMLAAEVWFLRRYSLPAGSLVSSRFVWVQVMISVVTILVEGYAILTEAIAANRNFNVVVCIALWLINLFTYYLFYTIHLRTEENQELTSLAQKAELEQEKYHATRLNYEELRTIRHEIKNHNFYLKALLDEGKVEEARGYLERVSARDAEYLQSFDCGNYVVDVVMNHEMAVAKEQDVNLRTEILVPQQLPFRDEDLCSLLSNLLDNAIEAASVSGKDNPEVTISILPRQEYLFIRVINPVDESIPVRKRLSLETTKTENSDLHGFGTRIIRRIAETYNGSVKFDMADGIFTTDVMLEMPEEKGDAT